MIILVGIKIITRNHPLNFPGPTGPLYSNLIINGMDNQNNLIVAAMLLEMFSYYENKNMEKQEVLRFSDQLIQTLTLTYQLWVERDG